MNLKKLVRTSKTLNHRTNDSKTKYCEKLGTTDHHDIF